MKSGRIELAAKQNKAKQSKLDLAIVSMDNDCFASANYCLNLCLYPDFATVLAVVHACLLDVATDPDSNGEVADKEEDGGSYTNPTKNGQDEDSIGRQRRAISSVKDAGTFTCAISVISACVLLLGDEKTGCDDAPGTAKSMNGDSPDDIIYLKPLKEFGAKVINRSTN